jgi:hypothetical protein
MKMMGMSDWSLMSAWYVIYGIMFGIIALLVAALTAASLFPGSSFVLLFIFFFVYGWATIAVCYLIR